MKCEYCVEDIAETASVCPHCRRATRLGRSERSRKALLIVAAPVVVLAVLIVAGMSQHQKTPGERMKQSCARQYGAGTSEAQECELALVIRALEKDDRDRMSRAAAGAR